MRPNIRVEIQNNLVEAMEVDENEEGEVSDAPEGETLEKHVQVTANETDKISKPSFPTALSEKKEDEKLQERARRFCLNPQEIKNFKDEDLNLLHCSLGISPTNESNVRFEVIHLRGIDQMTAGDILDYFLDYAPVSVEWIDEECCNVVWLDKILSARALHFMSKPVRGMPVRDDSSYFDNLHEPEEVDESILVINRNREIQLKEDSEEGSNKLFNEQNSVDISEITATIPPGYWRLGASHPRSKCLLLRFGLKTDKKHFKSEQFSRYYKNKNKKKVSVTPQITHGIFGRNKDMYNIQARADENPWSILAKNWDEDAQFREKERTQETEEAKLQVKNQSLRNRLGMKRKEEEEEEEPSEPEVSVPKKRAKVPRMRMYADEEEEKLKRKKMLQRINNQIKKIDQDTSTNSDLRTILNMTSRTHGVKLEKAEPEVFDLGSTLKNRNKKMVFQIKTEADTREHRSHSHSKSHKEREKVSRRKYSYSDEEDTTYHKYSKPKSKVAVVIKTQKKPSVRSAVASTVWSRVSQDNSESESESTEDESSESESEEEVEEFVPARRTTSRPGFKHHSVAQYKSPLKIEISNDHFKRL